MVFGAIKGNSQADASEIETPKLSKLIQQYIFKLFRASSKSHIFKLATYCS